MFDESFEVLLYDLTSTYFECDVPESDSSKRKFGHSRDKRHDCVQVVIALIVTPRGLPIAYEVMPGNTSDKTALWEFVQNIEKQYGKVSRTWIMDRGITPQIGGLISPRNDNFFIGLPSQPESCQKSPVPAFYRQGKLTHRAAGMSWNCAPGNQG